MASPACLLYPWTHLRAVRDLHATIDELAALPAGERTAILQPEHAAFTGTELEGADPGAWPAYLRNGKPYLPAEYFAPFVEFITRSPDEHLQPVDTERLCNKGHIHRRKLPGIVLSVEVRDIRTGLLYPEPLEWYYGSQCECDRTASNGGSGDGFSHVILWDRLVAAQHTLPLVYGLQLERGHYLPEDYVQEQEADEEEPVRGACGPWAGRLRSAPTLSV